MSREPTDTPTDPKALWRNQSTEEKPIPLEDIKKRAAKFQARVRGRNLLEYLAAVLVVAAFGRYAWMVPDLMIRMGAVATIVATLIVVWQLHQRGSARAPSLDASTLEVAEFHRGELIRQRDALRSVWLWYLAPFIPGVALTMLGRYFQFHARGRSLERDHQIILFSAFMVAVVFGLIWLLNAFAASRLQRQIDAMDRMRAA